MWFYVHTDRRSFHLEAHVAPQAARVADLLLIDGESIVGDIRPIPEMVCQHIDTCLACYLNDHHNREGELLIGVFVDGNSTNGGVLRELLLELQTACASIDPADLPGFDYDSAKVAAKYLFSHFSPNELFDSSLEIDEDADPDEIEPGEMAQAWFLFTWQKEDELS